MSARPRAELRRGTALAAIGSAAARYFLLLAAFWMAGVDARAAELTFNLQLANGRVPENMQRVRVAQGDVVTLRWSVDRPVILHLHGYDIEKRIEPGAAVEMTFTARATGRFPVHAHAAGIRASNDAREEPPVLHVEVYPR